jgi:RNA 2',3'-cyclic 3'-phosphodiesterase
MEETIRSFIAIELSPQAHDELASLQSALQKAGADVKWVEPENIHLTLKFLGDLEPKKAEEVKELLIKTVSGFKPFELSMKGAGAFPSLSSPRVIWAGVGLGAAESMRIAETIETKLQGTGIPGEERKFHPHMTLGRVRSPKNCEKLRGIIETIKFETGSKINVNHLTLFRSRLSPQGPLYTPLFKASMAIS